MRVLPLLLALGACGSAGGDEVGGPVVFGTIDGRPGPPKRTPDRLPAIPDDFRGRWARGGDCSPAAGALLIERLRVVSPGAVGTATYILRAGAREISMEMDMTDARGRRTDSLTLTRLSSDRLRRSTPDGTEAVFTRCPVTGA